VVVAHGPQRPASDQTCWQQLRTAGKAAVRSLQAKGGLASQVFDIGLEQSAAATAIDGRFRCNPLQNRTVDIKWYLKREGLLDTSESDQLDYYLVLTGPAAAAASSRGTTRPWCIEAVFLFDAQQLRAEQTQRGVRRGAASSVLKQQWLAAEIYPYPRNPLLPISHEQSELLALFHP
jgi:hypothetical protein